jgi:hypothetical protein
MRKAVIVLLSLLAVVASCGCAPACPLVSAVDAAALPTHGAVTVLVFFSAECHCLSAHGARLVAFYERYHPRGVDLLMMDSESTGSTEADVLEARRRGYPFPIVRDPGARLARALGAQYASYAIVLDAQRRIRYRGGIDSDESRLHDDARLFVQDAVDDLLAGRSPRVAEGQSFGCALRTW